jgi:UDP-N-acetylglucosamine acyltransferase
MPGVLMIETLTQVASVLLFRSMDGNGAGSQATGGRVYLRGVDNAKFRRQVVPGDRLRLEVVMGARRSRLARAHAVAYIGDDVVAEAELMMGLVGVRAEASREAAAGGEIASSAGTRIHPTAIVHPSARVGQGTEIGPYVTIGAQVQIGRNCRIGASAVIDGPTEIGDGNEIFPMASVGLIPQDLKFGGESTRLVIGHRNVIREFVTIHRGTAGGGGVTRIGDRNLFMAYAHVAHDCQVGNETIFANGATLAGHVLVEDYATVGAFSGVHQYCRVGRHAFIGGYSVVTKDALPFAKTVGNRARIYGVNTIGLVRRRFSPDAIAKLRRAYRHLLHSNTSRALAQIERDPSLRCDEVQYVVDFIRTSSRGVGLRRPSRRLEQVMDE